MERAGDPAAITVLQPYIAALANKPNAFSTLNWMTTSRGFRTLRELANGQLALTHQALDSIKDRGLTTHYLRAELVTHGALPERHEQSAHISAIIDRELATLPEGRDRLHLRTFATWKILHELHQAERHGRAQAKTHQHARRQIVCACELLHWFTQRDLTLQQLRQEHLDQWLAEGPENRKHVRAFIRWAARHRITGPLSVDPPSTLRHVDPADPNERLTLLRQLLTDESLDLRDRFAGSLVLLFAQRTSRLVLLTKTDIQEHEGEVFVRLGNEPLLLPKTLGTLARELRDTSPGPKTTTTNTDSPWLFPGRLTGTHLTDDHLRQRLWRLGIKTLPARTQAIRQLGHTVPAAILADLLGYADTTTERWTTLASGDWTRYAAHRTDPHQTVTHAPGRARAVRAPTS